MWGGFLGGQVPRGSPPRAEVGSGEEPRSAQAKSRGRLRRRAEVGSGEGGLVVDQDPIEEGLAEVDEALMERTVLLVEVVVGEGFEVEGACVIEGVIGDGPGFGGGGAADGGAGEVGDFGETAQFGFEEGALFRGEVFFEPEVNVVDHGGGRRELGNEGAIAGGRASYF